MADVLAPRPLAAEAIADAVGARASQLRRVLRALVAAGVFCELEDGRFASNDAAAALRADAPGRTRDVVVNFGEEMYRSFGELLHTVRTGETAFDSVYGAPLFEYYAANPETEASAAARMMARTLPVAREFAASDVLRGARTLVDVGGGTGTLVAEVLRHRPEIAGVLLERPGMLALARGIPLRAGRGRSLRARRGRLLLVGPGRWRRLCPQERPARLGRRAVRRDPAQLPCGDG